MISEQYPFEPLKFLPKTLKLTFAEGIELLREAGIEVRADPLNLRCFEEYERVPRSMNADLPPCHLYHVSGRSIR